MAAEEKTKSDPYKIAKLAGVTITIIAILISWIFAISSTQMRVGENAIHLDDLESRMRIVGKSSQRTNVLLQVMNKKLDKIDKRLER